MPSRVSVLGAAALLALSLLTSVTVAQAGAEPGRANPRSTATAAQQALADAQALFAGGARRDNRAAHRIDAGRDATLVLRDLAAARPRLSGEDRAAADAILARPTDGPGEPGGDGYTTSSERLCAADVCVHWVESTVDAVPLADGDDAGTVPDYVDTALATLQGVHDTYDAAGYRSPKPDGTRGGDARTDVYLAEVGDDGLYGYCTDDDPATTFDQWAYCVLDNDYRPGQFGTRNTPLENVQVTAAHEYFHAVQYAYDAFEDGWFMEATATWAEDELFDGVDDNVFYLRESALTNPRRALDRFGGLFHYGNWIFFRHLTERMRTSQGDLPTLVRDFWRRADSTQGPQADYHSIRAVKAVLANRGAGFTAAFTRFAEASRRSREVYDEGSANRYPVAPLWDRLALSPTRRSTRWAELRLDHLASATARFTPSSGMTNRRWKLRLQLDLAPRSRGSSAIATTYHRSKAPTTTTVRLDRRGDGSVRLPFSSRRVDAVELTVVNASTRMNCWVDQNSPYSCLGSPRDDNQLMRFRGTAVR
jgi:hypothetical protein